MRKIFISFFLFTSSLLFAAGTTQHHKGKAIIKGTTAGSPITGIVLFDEVPGGMIVTVHIENAPPGKHGFHVHEFGDISDQGKAAGGHYNPEGVQHGYILNGNYSKAHAGDFGNLKVNENGKVSSKFMVPGLFLQGGKYNVAGRAVIFHEKQDDFGQPTGNAGARIAGGTIIITADEIGDSQAS